MRIRRSSKLCTTWLTAGDTTSFLFDSDRNLIYRGQLDGSRPGNDIPTNGKSLRSAIQALLNNEDPISEQLPSMGCNIKWRVGEEPDYFLNVKG